MHAADVRACAWAITLYVQKEEKEEEGERTGEGEERRKGGREREGRRDRRREGGRKGGRKGGRDHTLRELSMVANSPSCPVTVAEVQRSICHTSNTKLNPCKA